MNIVARLYKPVDAHVTTHAYEHVDAHPGYGHVYGHVYAYVHINVYGHAPRQLDNYIAMFFYICMDMSTDTCSPCCL